MTRLTEGETSVGRRVLLGALAAGVGTAAGCLGGDTAGDGEAAAEGDGDEQDVDLPEHPVERPRNPPEGRRCDGPCGMVTTDWPAWNAQLAHGDGRGAFFDTPGCLLTYRHDPTFYDGPESAIENAWVRDFGSRELIDAAAAVYVLDTDKERHEEANAYRDYPLEES